ncbi:glycerol-3-phosphate 1-O-acyltransferase PlsB [Marinicella sp. W31]|uniref:glycerol-3-phosphate 1-O-acyltransferase PlsB n=1 Tax=Marinicella sp. W31 TaxID=3023713 RepID=UPI003756A84C
MSLLSRLLYLRVRVEYSPDKLDQLGIQVDQPLYYVLSTDSHVSKTIMHEEIHRKNLPNTMPLHDHPDRLPGILANKQLTGIWNRKPEYDTFKSELEALISWLQQHPEQSVQIVPTSVFLGRAPKKNHGFFKILFSEKWKITGRLRKLMSILVHGNHTLLRLSKPIVLDQSLIKNQSPRKLAHKISRVLRVHSHRIKTAVVGPDLSHRRTIARNIINRPQVQKEIKAYANRRGISMESASKEANKIIREIAADYSYSSIKFMHRLFRWFWTKVYDGVQVNFFDEFRSLTTDNEIIYTPCHRSHIDYLIMSYALYERGLVPPHIAAGINLNLPLVGRILRGSGAFFIRRSFNSVLYSTIFSEYLSSLISHGISIEYFVEGSRSRTGRLLPPKGGMLAMTIKSYINERSNPLLFQPASLNYEKLMEGGSYQKELGGKSKKKESIGGLFRALKLLKNEYGRLTVNMSEPIALDDILDKYQPEWRDIHLDVKEKPAWFKEAVNESGRQIMVQINRSSHVNPINLIAICLLTTPNHSAPENNLRQQIDLYKQLLAALPYSERTTITKLDIDEIIETGIRLGFIERVEHELGDVIRVLPNMGVMLTYYRNNILHLFATSSFVAMCFGRQQKFVRKHLIRLMKVVYPFIRSELYLHWTRDEFVQHGLDIAQVFKEKGLLSSIGRTMERPPGGSMEAAQLKVLGNALKQTYERYFLVMALLQKQGNGSLSPQELESLCQKVASQLTLLYEFNSPDFFDRALFRQFISTLKDEKLITLDGKGKIVYADDMEPIFEAAKLILSKRIRHSILSLIR